MTNNALLQNTDAVPSIKRILSGYASYTHVPKGLETASDISMDEAGAQLEALIQQRINKIEKAYGGCHTCYGKGYATQKSEARGRGVRWDTSGIVFCECNRGKQLEREIGKHELDARIDEYKNHLPHRKTSEHTYTVKVADIEARIAKLKAERAKYE